MPGWCLAEPLSLGRNRGEHLLAASHVGVVPRIACDATKLERLEQRVWLTEERVAARMQTPKLEDMIDVRFGLKVLDRSPTRASHSHLLPPSHVRNSPKRIERNWVAAEATLRSDMRMLATPTKTSYTRSRRATELLAFTACNARCRAAGGGSWGPRVGSAYVEQRKSKACGTMSYIHNGTQEASDKR